jgi:signal transduction histidine kinase
MIEEVRRIAMNLRPSTLDDLGILPTLGWFCREFRGLHPQLAVAAIVEVREEEIADALKTALYRIVQEAFNNVVTHAGARNISLSLQRVDHHIRLRIADDGKGFDEQALARLDGNAGGLGLASMRQRVESAGGRFSIGSKPGEGTTIVAVWPGMAR